MRVFAGLAASSQQAPAAHLCKTPACGARSTTTCQTNGNHAGVRNIHRMQVQPGRPGQLKHQAPIQLSSLGAHAVYELMTCEMWLACFVNNISLFWYTPGTSVRDCPAPQFAMQNYTRPHLMCAVQQSQQRMHCFRGSAYHQQAHPAASGSATLPHAASRAHFFQAAEAFHIVAQFRSAAIYLSMRRKPRVIQKHHEIYQQQLQWHILQSQRGHESALRT